MRMTRMMVIRDGGCRNAAGCGCAAEVVAAQAKDEVQHHGDAERREAR
jgi:hypothetical protein